ncbi:MAG: hypothetical protein B6I28_05030, partial [Fusobacteriia bacterium 4572_132]
SDGVENENPALKGVTSNNSVEATAVYRENVISNVEGIISKDGNEVNLKDYTKLNEGDVILVNLGNTSVAKKVTKVINGNLVEVETAEMDAVYEKLEINESVDLTEENLEKDSLPAGVSLETVENYSQAAGAIFEMPNVDSETSEEGLRYSIKNWVIADASSDAGKIHVEGNATVLLKKPTIDVDFSWWHQSLNVVVNTGDTAKITFDGNMDYAALINRKIDLGTYVIPINVAGIPTGTISMRLSMDVSINGKVDLHAEATQNVDMKFGVDGKLKDLKNVEFIHELTVPEGEDYFGYELDTNGNVETAASVSPYISVTILQYNVVETTAEFGIEAKAKGNLDISGNEGDLFGGTGSYDLLVRPYAWVDVKVMKEENQRVFDWEYVVNKSGEFTK